jgi:hypothetical protein
MCSEHYVSRKVHIGDVVVCRGMPEGRNPFGKGLIGPERIAALTALANHQPTDEYTFWYAPFRGPVQNVSGYEINWETSRIIVDTPGNC